MSTLASDDFTTDNLATDWDQLKTNNFTVGSGVLSAPSSGTREWLIWATTPFGTTDYSVQADIVFTSGTFHGICGRAIVDSGDTDEIHGFVAHIDDTSSGRVTLYTYGPFSTTWTLRGTDTTITLSTSTSYPVKLIMNGTGSGGVSVQVDTGSGLTDRITGVNGSIVTHAGVGGIKSGGSGTTWDNWICESIAAGGGVPAGTLGLLGVGI